MPRFFGLVVSMVFLLMPLAAAHAQELQFAASSFLGGSGDADRIVGTRIQSDGTFVLAANLASDFAAAVKPTGEAAQSGCILRLTPDGQKLLSMHRLTEQLKDLSLDDQDNIYVAAGKSGLFKLTPAADKIIWSKPSQGSCDRVDAARDGHSAALVAGPGGASILIFDPQGKELGQAKGRGYTNDVCIDSATKIVIFTGFRNARAHDGKRVEPVQIAYVQALNYDGSAKWCDYDWSTDQNSDRFVNRSGNNMADTRGYRCAIGRDGRLYVAFEAAGGNHIFRYSPNNIMEKAAIVGGDGNHSFHASAAEHKTIVCRYEVDSGKFLLGQQWCGRRPNGKANAARMKDGDIAADEQGRVYLAGLVGENIPVKPDPLPGASASGAYLLVLSPDMKTRLFCTRTAGGKGSSHGIDARTIGGRLSVVYGGSAMESDMFTQAPIQKESAGKDAFFVVVRGQ